MRQRDVLRSWANAIARLASAGSDSARCASVAREFRACPDTRVDGISGIHVRPPASPVDRRLAGGRGSSRTAPARQRLRVDAEACRRPGDPAADPRRRAVGRRALQVRDARHREGDRRSRDPACGSSRSPGHRRRREGRRRRGARGDARRGARLRREAQSRPPGAGDRPRGAGAACRGAGGRRPAHRELVAAPRRGLGDRRLLLPRPADRHDHLVGAVVRQSRLRAARDHGDACRLRGASAPARPRRHPAFHQRAAGGRSACRLARIPPASTRRIVLLGAGAHRGRHRRERHSRARGRRAHRRQRPQAP